MAMIENNTIAGFHIKSSMEETIMQLNTTQLYNWHIPKMLRNESIQQGDIVLVHSRNNVSRVLVMNVSREELEETGKRYKRVVKILERAPKKVEQC